MKRIIAAVLVAVFVCLSFVACNGSFECECCKQTVEGKKHVVEFYGSEVVACGECKAYLEQLMEDIMNQKDIFG